MHVERHGGAPNLQKLFHTFVLNELRGRSLDDDKKEEAKQGKFPDFACCRDIVLIEMKHLETPQKERIQEIIDRRLDPDEKPFFYGQRRSTLATLSNGAEITTETFAKLARTIETHLDKANRQFASYQSRHPRKNSISICLLLNSGVDEFSPDVVMYCVQGKMKPAKDRIRFPAIDLVMYISEKHVQRLPDGRAAFVVSLMASTGAAEAYWKINIAQRIAADWSRYRSGGEAVAASLGESHPVEDVPPTMRRHEAWKLAYRRNPYLRPLTDHELKLHFHRCVAINSLGMVEGSWPKPSQDEIMLGFRDFDDAIQEINHREIDLRIFKPGSLTFQDRATAYRGLPEELVRLLTRNPS